MDLCKFIFLILFLEVKLSLTRRVLVLVDNMYVKDTHSIFLRSLQERGHKLTVKTADDPSLTLRKYGEHLYEHLIIFAPGVDDFGGSITVRDILSFIDNGGSLLMAAGNRVGDAIRDLAAENGFEFDDDKTSVIDHLNYDIILDEGDHTVIVADPKNLISAPMIVGSEKNHAPILYKGVALTTHNTNRLRLEVLSASTTAYSFNPNNPIEEYPSAVGRSVLLVGALQARNNARIVLTGSVDMFSDRFINSYANKINSGSPMKSGNLHLITELSKWVLMEKGVLQVKSVTHNKVGEKSSPHEYTIMNEVEYAIEIEELKDDKWLPFEGNDVQLEFVRIDPFIRTTLKNKAGRLSARLKLPDVYGVFKFVVDYRRVGFTHLLDIQQISVRPLEHTKYERFIRSAYPYYLSSFSMMAGVVFFSFVFLYHKEAAKDTKKDS